MIVFVLYFKYVEKFFFGKKIFNEKVSNFKLILKSIIYY